MNINDLRYFTYLAKVSSFTKTAAHFYVTQPTISMAMKRLEKEFKTKLFVKDSKSNGYELTPTGNILYLRSENILKNLELTKFEIKNFTSGKVFLGIPPIIGSYLLPKLLPRLKDYSQKLDLIEKTGSETLLELLSQQKLTTGIVGMVEEIELNNVKQYYVTEDYFYLCFSKNHPLAHKKNFKISDILNENFVSLGEGYIQYKVFNQWMKNNKIIQENVRYINDVRTAMALVSTGVVIGFFIGLLAEDRDDIIKIPLRELPSFKIKLLINQEVNVSPLQHSFNNFLVDIINSMQFNK